jgi:hypothetical protein
MLRHRIRTWLDDRIRRSPRVRDYLVGAGSVMVLFPTEDAEPPAFHCNDRDALIADIRSVGRDLAAAYRGADEAPRSVAANATRDPGPLPSPVVQDEPRANWQPEPARQPASPAAVRG